MYCPCTCICNHSWQDDIKSRNFLVYHDASYFSFRCRWLRERTRLWNCEEHILGRDVRLWDTVGKDYAEVTERLGWEVWETSDICKIWLIWEVELHNFSREGSAGSRRRWQWKLCIFLEEVRSELRELAGKNCVDIGGSHVWHSCTVSGLSGVSGS